MKLSDRVTSVKLSLQLSELGFKCDTAWSYYDDPVGGWKLAELNFTSFEDEYIGCSRIPAYTVAELLDILPENYFVIKWCSQYSALNWNGSRQREKGKIADTAANALALMLIKVIKEKNYETS